MRKIFLYDEFKPQDIAMMQALYSRSPLSVEAHVEKVRQSGSGNFMERFYVGYGNMSIADCGSTTLFIEGISMLADKAIQDWPMYSGQETSTRYIDMSKQAIMDPVGTPESKKILDDWMGFYIGHQEKVCDFLKGKYPRKHDEDEKVYDKAIKARAFDIMRGFLPAGITTQLSWHTNLRQAWDKLSLLRHHPLVETREIAEEMLAKLREKYNQSFSHPHIGDQEEYRCYAVRNYNYYEPKKAKEFAFSTTVKKSELKKYAHLLEVRPPRIGLPHFLTELGQATFDFRLDFGSFRDIQRHRNGVCRMPLLTTKLGFERWYLEQLPGGVRADADELIEKQVKAIAALGATPEVSQYYIAMGFQVPCRVTYGLPAAVYVAELRSNKTVHPTLRKIAHQMTEVFRKKFPILKLHSDQNPDDWDVRRGLADITERK
jgi:thymidylate synthase ThyX